MVSFKEQRETVETSGKTIQIAAKNVVKFKAGAELEGAVN
jgi:nucleoid DNA-binding protein